MGKKEKKLSVLGKKVLAPIPIPTFYLGFGRTLLYARIPKMLKSSKFQLEEGIATNTNTSFSVPNVIFLQAPEFSG